MDFHVETIKVMLYDKYCCEEDELQLEKKIKVEEKYE